MKKLILTAVIAAATLASVAPAASAEVIWSLPGNYSGEMSGINVKPDWTSARVKNISVTYNGCNDGRPCVWQGIIGTYAASLGRCPKNPFDTTGATAVELGTRNSNGTINAQDKEIWFDGAFGQRVCVYILRHPQGDGYPFEAGLVMSPLAPPPGVEGPPTQPRMTVAQAKKKANGKLAKKYGRSWKRGKSKHVTCRKASTAFVCKATWKFKNKRKRGTVRVPRT